MIEHDPVQNRIACPALFIAAPSSGQGKTTVTAALARYHRDQGRHVRVFKSGPDFLDPMILERASDNPVYQLDLWMGGENHCRQLLYEAAKVADLILIEGVMGLYDGSGQFGSTADLAQLFNIPVLAVIDATAMAQTFGAIAHGLATYRSNLPFAGVIANRVASANHADMLAESLPENIRYFGGLPRGEHFSLPSRHLGLVQASEVEDLEQRIDLAAHALAQLDVNLMPDPVQFEPGESGHVPMSLANHRVGIAQDDAFSFLYPANVDVLRVLGAEICFFSPLNDQELPEVDSLYFPGGYPELFADRLQNNKAMRNAIQAHFDAGKPIVAECGGMLYLSETLTDKEGRQTEMLGLIPGNATMQNRLGNLGMQSLFTAHGELRGHSYHHSVMETSLTPVAMTQPSRKKGRAEAVLQKNNMLASYMHLYLPSNPGAGGHLFNGTLFSETRDF